MADQVSALAARTERLENLLAGPNSALANAKNEEQLLNRLSALNHRLTSILGKRANVAETVEKMPEIRRLTDPSYSTALATPVDAKLKMIELNCANVHERIASMEAIEKLLPVLDSEHIRNAPEQLTKLQQLSFTQAEQIELVASHSSEVAALIRVYNEHIRAVNQQLVYWDQLLTRLEQEKTKKA